MVVKSSFSPHRRYGHQCRDTPLWRKQKQLSLSRLNYQWPECEVHPEVCRRLSRPPPGFCEQSARVRLSALSTAPAWVVHVPSHRTVSEGLPAMARVAYARHYAPWALVCAPGRLPRLRTHTSPAHAAAPYRCSHGVLAATEPS